MNLQSVKQRFGIIGSSQTLDNQLNRAIRAASTDLSVLITGESGVGKEVFSKIIHELSPRKHNKRMPINCGALPEGTINSELFGHEKGAFTGAISERKGYFETFNGGTIFLDEVGEMPLDTQAFLLRVLESGEFVRVGSSKVLKTDVRVVAATNASLLDKIRAGKFRNDLYFRLNTVPIQVPALSERREDISLLFRKFASDYAEKYRSETIRLDEGAVQLLESYKWPGNIRELKNIAEQVSLLATNRNMTAEDLLKFIPKAADRNLPMVTGDGKNNGENFHEREILYKLLFDMKKDLNDLKSLVFELISNNNLSVPDLNKLPQFTQYEQTSPTRKEFASYGNKNDNESIGRPASGSSKPIIIDPSSNYNNAIEVEETLSLEDMEKDMIQKALTKHKGKRKDAASELGISERTLYRKIKYYDVKE